MKTFLSVIFMLAAVVITSQAQAPPSPEAAKAEMKKLDKLVGQWKGSGWIQQGPNRETFAGTENVQSKVQGLAILIEGKFSNPEGKVIHETLAAMSFDPKVGNYRMKTYLASGISGEYDFKAVGENFEWGFEAGGMTIKYTITATASTWQEVGEYSRDAKTWTKFFEMKLDKVK
ncbi:MAG: hypothetical protein ABIR33_03810 [Pyrinomonadaceae bacterium]